MLLRRGHLLPARSQRLPHLQSLHLLSRSPRPSRPLRQLTMRRRPRLGRRRTRRCLAGSARTEVETATGTGVETETGIVAETRKGTEVETKRGTKAETRTGTGAETKAGAETEAGAETIGGESAESAPGVGRIGGGMTGIVIDGMIAAAATGM